MSSYKVLTPHRKKTTTFVEFGGKFPGVLRNASLTYGTYAYWVYQVPGNPMPSGWYSAKPSDAYLDEWQYHIDNFDRPDAFGGEFRNLFGYTKASCVFAEMRKKYR